MFGCNNDRLLTEKYTVKDHISNSKQEKGDHYYIQTRHKDLFSHYNLIVRKLEEKCPEKRSKIQTKCAHAPWASYMAAVSVKRSIGYLKGKGKSRMCECDGCACKLGRRKGDSCYYRP